MNLKFIIANVGLFICVVSLFNTFIFYFEPYIFHCLHCCFVSYSGPFLAVGNSFKFAFSIVGISFF